jgi:hypothetical protein
MQNGIIWLKKCMDSSNSGQNPVPVTTWGTCQLKVEHYSSGKIAGAESLTF